MTALNRPAPTILIDMDGTLFHWGRRLNEILLRLDQAFPIVDDEARIDFDHLAGEGADRTVLKAAMNHPDLYKNLEPIAGSVKALKEMESAGLNLFICSTPTWSNPGCVDGKLEDIRDVHGAHLLERTILTHDKTVVRGDVLVDDKPTITGAMEPTWRHLMADHSHNRSILGVPRLLSWDRWEEALYPLLEDLAA